MKKTTGFVSTGLLLLAGTSLLKVHNNNSTAQAQTQTDLSKVSLKAAVTLPAEVPDFEPRKVGSDSFAPRKIIVNKASLALPSKPIPAAWLAHGISAHTHFVRASDKMRIEVSISVCETEADAKAITDEARLTQTYPIPEGSFTKRAIGQHVYSFPAENGKFPGGHNRIIVQDGYSLITVSATTQIQNVNGRPVFVELPAQYVTLCEDLAQRVLDRLTFLGHTSQSPNSAPKEAKQQVLDWIAAHPTADKPKP